MKAHSFNKRFNIGDKVIVDMDGIETIETKIAGEAWEGPNGYAVVKLEDISGPWACDRIKRKPDK